MSRSVLIVDHVATRRTSLKRLLDQQQYQVLESASCEAALTMISQRRIDIVLTETELPTKSGLFLLKEAKQKHPDIEVILLTHNASSYNLLQALRNGAYDFIVRPIDSGEILFHALEKAYRAIQLRHDNQQLIVELEAKNHLLADTLSRLQELNKSIEKIAATTEPGELLNELLNSAVEQLHASRGLLALGNHGTAPGIKISRGLDAEFCQACSSNVPDGLLNAIFQHNRPILIASQMPQKLQEKATDLERQYLLQTPGLLAVPLRRGMKQIGLLALAGHPEQKSFTESDLQFLTQLSHHATLALEKAGMIRQLQQNQTEPI